MVGAQEEQEAVESTECLRRLNPRPGDRSRWGRSSVWPRWLFSVRFQKPTAPAGAQAVIDKLVDPNWSAPEHQLPWEKGKASGYYVPKAAEEATRGGLAAWQKLQECFRELAELNKDRNLERSREVESG